MYGVMRPLRQVLMTARPWQTSTVGAVVLVVGILLGSIVLGAAGALVFLLPLVRGASEWRRRRHGVTDVAEQPE